VKTIDSFIDSLSLALLAQGAYDDAGLLAGTRTIHYCEDNT
jgi:hypothetical protein